MTHVKYQNWKSTSLNRLKRLRTEDVFVFLELTLRIIYRALFVVLVIHLSIQIGNRCDRTDEIFISFTIDFIIYSKAEKTEEGEKTKEGRK